MKYKKYLLVIFTASLLIRFVYVGFFLDNKKYYFEDTIHYYTAAVNIVENGTFGQDPEKPNQPFTLEPVYSIVLAGIIFIFGKSFLAIRLMQSIILCSSGILFFLILKRLTSDLFAFIGTIIYLFYPFYVGFSGLLLPESIYLPLLVFFIFLSLEYVYSGKVVFLYSSVIILGILFHTKVTSILLIVPLLLLPLIRYKRINLVWINKVFISMFIIFLLSVPWGVRNYQIWGKVSIPRTRGSSENQSELAKQTSSILKGEHLKSIALNAYNLYSPFLTKFSTKNEFNKDIFQIMTFLCVMPLLISTVVLLFFRRNRFVIILYSFLIFYSLPFVIIFGQTRYRLPMDFVMIIFLTLLLEYSLKKYKYKYPT